jgi:hypothetical protein
MFMAKVRKEESQANGSGKGTFRFRYMDSSRQFEVQADNVSGENLLEGFRHVANAITGRNIAPAPKLLKTTAAAASASAEVVDPKENQEEFEFEPETPPAPEVVEENADEQATDGAGGKKPRRAPRAPKFLDELNLTTAKVQLVDFIKEKNPDSDVNKYAVIAVWYKQHFNTDEISIDHIFTAYDVLGWKAQLPGPDPTQTLRNLKNVKNWLTTGSKRGFFKVNWHCEDAVNKMGTAKTAAQTA